MGRRTVLSDADMQSIIEERKAGADIRELARKRHVGTRRVRQLLESHGLGSRQGKRFRLSAEAEAEMVARYAAGESPLTLGPRYGCNPATVRHAARRAGVPVNHVGGDPKVRTPEEIATLRALAAQGLSQGAIAKRMSMHQATVSNLMREHGIPVLKKGVGRGAQHGGWKGGRSTDAKGYILIRLEPNDPYASMGRQGGYAAEHRVVMARYLGRPLTRHETVHHKNGDITDNRIENLQLCIGNHSNAQSFRCSDCGSYNVVAIDLVTGQPVQ